MPTGPTERALAALGHERCACVDTLDGWQRHAADLRVLVLAPRRASETHPRRDPRAVAGWSTYGPVPSQPIVTVEDKNALPDLLALGGGLPQRLVATVAASRLGGHAPDERARLHAALYGRATAALRDWLGPLSVELATSDATRLIRDGDRIEAELPFSWLVEVWATGLAVIWGRFCLAASTEDWSPLHAHSRRARPRRARARGARARVSRRPTAPTPTACAASRA